jgi:hypothetical protein
MSSQAEIYNFPAGHRGDRSGGERLFRDACRVGTVAPDFSLQTTEGSEVQFYKFIDRWRFVVLEFGSIT